MDFAFDLWDYTDMRDNATAILDAVTAAKMHCDGSWTQDKVEQFRKWA